MVLVSAERTNESADLGTAATLLAVLTTVGVCWGAGVELPGTVAGFGALGVVWGVALAASDRLGRRAVGSVLVTGGLFAVIVGFNVAVLEGVVEALLVAGASLAILAVGAAGVDATTDWASFAWSVRDSTVTSLPVVAGTYLLATGAVGTLFFATAVLLEALTSSTHASVLSVLALLAVAVLLASCAGTVLELARLDRTSPLTFRSVVGRVADLPTGGYYVLVVAGFVLAAPGTGDAIDSVLRAMGPVGTLVLAVLWSGGLHVVLLGVALGAVVICLGWLATPPLRAWFGPYPLRTAAFATGGVVVPPVAFLVASAVPSIDPLLAIWAVFGSLLAVVVVELVVASLASGVDEPRRWLRRLGCGSILGVAFVGSRVGTSPIGVFLAVAAAITVWDLSERTQGIRTHLGPWTDSRQTELVHATATVVVGGLGVGLAALAMYGIGAVDPPSQRWHALAPVTLALLAVLALAGSIGVDADWASASTLRGVARDRLRIQVAAVLVVTVFVLVAAALVDAVDALLAVALLIGLPIAALWIVGRLSGSDFKQPPPGGY